MSCPSAWRKKLVFNDTGLLAFKLIDCVRLMRLLYIFQDICSGNILPNMWYMLNDMCVTRVAFMRKEA
jgi:hypothetical protein